MNAPLLDRERLAKCLALAEGGATEGERAAARAAAIRVAAAAGMTLGEAVRAQRPAGFASHESSRPPPRRDPPWAERARAPVVPISLDELIAQREAAERRRRRQATAHARHLAKELAEQALHDARQRELQHERDRAWEAERDPASARVRTGSPGP